MDQNTYKIMIDGNWSLEDLMNFSRVYFQNYSFIYCLEPSVVQTAISRTPLVLEKYELRHGLSYVNIYDIFKNHIARYDKPQVKSIQYASPGWIELALNPEVATQIAKVIGVYLGASIAVTETYKKLHKIFTDLQAKRKEHKNYLLQLDHDQVKTANELSRSLAQGLGFESIQHLDEHTKDVEESSKLLMAHYRRINKIAKFVQSGKASFPID